MSYKDLKTYRQTTIIYDYTTDFCNRYIDRKSCTQNQMIQAARSGKQNIVEVCSVSKTSPKNELFLLGVARGLLKKLLEDYKDFFRHGRLEIWRKGDPVTQKIRTAYKFYMTDTTDKDG